MRVTIVFSLTLFGLLLLGSCGTVLAQENDIGYSRIDPSSPLYFLKTIREGLEMNFALTPRTKLLRQLEFATRRLREARTLISKNADLIPPTMERYSSYLNSLPQKNITDSEVALRIKESSAIHLDTLYQMYSQVSAPGAKIAIRAAINRIIQRTDLPPLTKLPACSFLSHEASASGLNQTERFVLAQRAQSCFESLGLNRF